MVHLIVLPERKQKNREEDWAIKANKVQTQSIACKLMACKVHIVYLKQQQQKQLDFMDYDLHNRGSINMDNQSSNLAKHDLFISATPDAAN